MKKFLTTIGIMCAFLSISSLAYATEKIDAKFDLRDKISITIKNQRSTNNCWIMPITTAFETNVALKNKENIVISARHLDYSTSQTFKDGAVNKFGLMREANSSGTAEWALSYLTNGSGPILEEDMPYIEEFPKLDLYEVQRYKPIFELEDWVMFPRIYKTINKEVVTYLDEDDNIYTSSEVKNIRDNIKNHIKQNGAIYAEINIEGVDKYYNSNNSAYCCTNEDVKADHAVSIIGWDDNYSKEKFNESNRPQNDGAYIVLNSYGTKDKISSVFYVSYEDRNIEKLLYGIVSVGEKDYSKIYQYDELGRNSAMSLGNITEIYGANVFERIKTKAEYLTEITIATYMDVNYEVYVNSNDGEISSEKLTKIAQSSTAVTNGYHTINLETPILLTGQKFVVAVKYMSNKEVLIATETNFKYEDGSTPYANVTSNEGEGYYGVSLDEMEDLHATKSLENTNLCIKAITVIMGDINQDGLLTAVDLSLLKMYLVDLIQLDGQSLRAADINEDGKVTILDLSILKKLLVQ